MVFFPVVVLRVEPSGHSVVVEWVREIWRRFHRTSCCLREVRAEKKLLAWMENEQIKHHCCPKLVFPARSVPYCLSSSSAILWVKLIWSLAPNCRFPSWVCIFVGLSLCVHIYEHLHINSGCHPGSAVCLPRAVLTDGSASTVCWMEWLPKWHV